jgi:GNAT superfamily N-acetyltransferase
MGEPALHPATAAPTTPTGAALALRRALELVAQLVPGGHVDVDHSGIGTLSIPVPMPTMSGLLLPAGPVDAARLRELADGFVARRSPWSVRVSGPVRDEVTELAADLGLSRQVVPTLVRPLTPAPAPGPSGLVEEHVRVTDEEERSRWVDTAAAAFGMPPSAVEPLATPELVAAPAVRAYYASLDQHPVATALTVLDPTGWLGVFCVGTVPGARWLGLASRLTASALADGAAAGAHSACLQTTAMAASMYARLGFRDSGEDTVYFSTTAAAGT